MSRISKSINSVDLAEIVTGLLVNPHLLGQFSDPVHHQNFMLEIAGVVAKHCGGVVAGISEPSGDHEDEYTSSLLTVEMEDHLPGDEGTVWSLHDNDGWFANQPSTQSIQDLQIKVEIRKSELQSILARDSFCLGKEVRTFTMAEWKYDYSEGIKGYPRFFAAVSFGETTQFLIKSPCGKKVYQFDIEINNEVPCVHVYFQEEAVAHVHIFDDKTIFTPDLHSDKFEAFVDPNIANAKTPIERQDAVAHSYYGENSVCLSYQMDNN